MASSPTPQPQGQPQQDPSQSQAGVSPADQQANPLQQSLAQLAKVCEQIAQQNPIVQDDLMAARANFIQALQKTMMAARPQPEANPAPQQQ
jgi:hypothetical protein